MSTNGGSLEDCHTNVFALTELNGLKWKCLTTPLTQRAWTSLEQDPVLSAYAKCLQAGILCAWRRQPPQSTGTITALPLPDYRIDVVKELWVFWYSQEEPESLAEYTGHLACSEDGQGNWSVPGIQYETRTLFFKALHNLIERNLLKNGYIRIGKYFTRPYDVPSSDRIHCSPSYVNGLNFNFFVHGENTVCATVSMQRQPTLFRLSKRHLDLGKKQPIILGPWSLRAVLLPEQPRIVDTKVQQPSQPPPSVHECGGFMLGTGVSYPGPPHRDSITAVPHQIAPGPSSSSPSSNAPSGSSGPGTIPKEAVDRLWSEWLQFFCLIVNVEKNVGAADTVGYVGYSESTAGVGNVGDMPKMVLVDVDGVHMWYPSSLIVVQASDDLLLRSEESACAEEDADEGTSRFSAATPPATEQTRLRNVPSFRKMRKKVRNLDAGLLGGPRYNLMYRTMVNGVRAAQWYYEESCIAPSNVRRKENIGSPTSSGLGLLMSAASNDDDSRWNITDGMRRKEREENCACQQCQSKMVGGHSSSQSTTPQQGVCHPTQDSISCFNASAAAREECATHHSEPSSLFHQRSPSAARSPSPLRSPPWERKIAAVTADSPETDRSSGDWVRERNSRFSIGGGSGSRSSKVEITPEDRHYCPKSPEYSSEALPEIRRVQRSALLKSSRRTGSCKPVYQNLSPTSRPRSPACDAVQAGTSSSSHENGGPGGDLTLANGRRDDKRKGARDQLAGRLRKGTWQKFGRKRQIDDDLNWNGIEDLDVIHAADEAGEDGLVKVTSKEEGYDYAVEKENIRTEEECCERKPEPRKVVKQEVPESEENIEASLSAIHDASLFMQKESLLSTHGNINLHSGTVFGSNGVTSYLDDCNPSTVIDTRSPVDPGVTDSVHLSPPASNERVEPAILGGTVTNVLARVGGPPSVGDYMIYPTPPSVDATQSQQFSPQNTLIQSNPTTIMCPPNAQYACTALAQQVSAATSTEMDTSSLTVKQEPMELDEEKGNKQYLMKTKPVYGKSAVVEMALSGKFAGNIFTKDFLPSETKERKVLEGVYADQMQLIISALGKREKRQKKGRTPDYTFLRDRSRNILQHSYSSVHHYRITYSSSTQMMPSRCMPSSQVVLQNMGTSACGMPSSCPSAVAQFGQQQHQQQQQQQQQRHQQQQGYNGNSSAMMGMMGMNTAGCVPGSSMMQQLPTSSPMGMMHMNQPMQMPVSHLRHPSRLAPLSYSSPQAPPQHHAFMGQPPQYCGPAGMMNPTQVCAVPGNAMCSVVAQGMSSVGPMPPQHMFAGPVHTGPGSQYSPMHHQQPFQQLSHFVNTANFSGQPGMAPMNPTQQQMYQQQMIFRGNLPGLRPQQALQPPDAYVMESQATTPIEPPPSFSQAMSSQYPQVHSGHQNVGPLMYANSPHMMRVQQTQNTTSMMGSPHTPQTPMMGMPSSIGSPSNSSIFPSRMMNMQPVVDASFMTTHRTHPEGKSLVLAVLLQDTVLDLHYDSVFDACPICSCNGNIRAKELGVYVTPPEVLRQPPAQQQLIVTKPTSGFYNNTSNACNCGFSAVRHRYLSMKAGLFAEDAKEATDITEAQSQPTIPHTIWFDSMSGRDMNFIALLREQTLVRDLGGIVDQVSMLSMQCDRATQIERVGSDSSKSCEYIISEVDQRELPLVFQAACEVACMEMNCRRPRHDLRSVLLHEWGVQIANEMREPRESECMAVLQEIGPILEESLRIARSSPLFGSNNIVEGPLTWRFFDRKSLKSGGGMISGRLQDEDSAPEPLPYIVVASEKDSVVASPEILRMWDKMALGPYDQPKDILYIGVIPDNLMCAEKTKKYLTDLSRIYEQCRFGRHIPFIKETLRDGLLRVPTRYPVENPGECDNFLNQVERHMGDNKALISRLKAYMQCFENEMAKVLLSADYIFSRDSYRTLLAETQSHTMSYMSNMSYQGGTFVTPSMPSEQMPPPSIPPPNSSQMAITQQGPSSVGAPGSVGGASSGLCESLTPDNNGNDGCGSNPSGSLMSEQLIDGPMLEDEPNALPHVIVLYLVNPFLLGAEENPLVARVVTVALMRAFNTLLYRLGNKRRPQLQLELISLQTIFDYTGVISDFLKDDRGRLNAFDQGRLEKAQNERLSSADMLKTIAFSVYSQSRVLLPEVARAILPKSMTQFGPASSAVDLLNDLERKEPVFYKVPSKPYVLAPPLPVMQRANGDLMQINTDEAVLFVSYCLIGNDWLAATVTDHQGHLLDNCLINLRLKPDHKRVNMRYKHSSQIRDSLYRLWSYILGTLATGTKNWRLVIGRVGRIGHGEFKFWTQILCKSYLKQVGTRMKHACRSCLVMPGTTETPGLLSACLVSLEPEAHLRVFPSSFQHDDRFPKASRHKNLTTPDDCSCTHILVFPTSPELNLDHQGGTDAAELEEDDFSNLLTEEFGEEFSDLIGNGEDLMTNATGPPPQSAGFRLNGNTGIPSEYADISIENQPLATGYYISTAPASELPDWFWSACPSAKRRNPVHLKASLHLNTPNVQQGDDISSFGKSAEICHHQLDSQATADVLRYVLETYNALSWLNLDFVTGERRSCLPVHIQALMRLCNTVNRFIN